MNEVGVNVLMADGKVVVDEVTLAPFVAEALWAFCYGELDKGVRLQITKVLDTEPLDEESLKALENTISQCDAIRGLFRKVFTGPFE